MPHRRSKRPRHASMEGERSPLNALPDAPAKYDSLLPVEVIAEILEWIGEDGLGDKGLASVRLVSRKWQQAIGELMEKRAHREWYQSVSWGQNGPGVHRITQRLALLSLPHMSMTLKEQAGTVKLSGTVDDRTLQLLSEFPRLSSMYANRVQFTGAILETNKEFHTDGVWITNQEKLSLTDMQVLGGLKSLRTLTIWNCTYLAVSGLPYLSGCSYLHTLTWVRSAVSDAAVAALFHIPTLREMMFSGCSLITDVAMSHIARLKLITLTVTHCGGVTDAGVIALTHQIDSQLETLTLDSLNITDESMRTLARLGKLTKLVLICCPKVTDAGFGPLFSKGSLRTLHLKELPLVGDGAVSELCKPPCTLKSVDLNKCAKITDQSLHFLSQALSVTTLHLFDVPLVTDAGLRELLSLPRLSCIGLWGLPLVTQGSIEGIQRKPTVHFLKVSRCQEVPDISYYNYDAMFRDVWRVMSEESAKNINRSRRKRRGRRRRK